MSNSGSDSGIQTEGIQTEGIQTEGRSSEHLQSMLPLSV